MRGEVVLEVLGSNEVAKAKEKDFRGASSWEEEGEEQLQTWRRSIWNKKRIRSHSQGRIACGLAASDHLLGASNVLSH